MGSINVFKKGQCIVYKDTPHYIIDASFTNPGKGSAFYKVRLRNLSSDKMYDATFKSGESFEEADLAYRNTQYLYNDGENYYFMDLESYEQFPLTESDIGDQVKYLKEETICRTMFVEGKACGIQLPVKMEFEVISSPPGVKGDTATGGGKFVELENGMSLKVPLFIKQGEVIRVNTETGEYIERANK